MVRQRANRGRAHSDHSAGIPGGGAAGTRLARATWGVLILTIRREIPGGGAVGTRLARATWGVLEVVYLIWTQPEVLCLSISVGVNPPL
ncbi:hypothetical protein, partial [Klebsiella oxytoca]|uniref:hypothetical protein n=1 Tax=Klebsiella oxytoca TaxID=571 RepID=UPI0038B6D8DD